MNESSNSSHYQAFELTQKGYELRQWALAGEKTGEKYFIEFTRGGIGQGRPEPDADVYFLTGLVDHAFDVPIKESYAKSTNHIMTIVIDNENIVNDVLMTEMGIFAQLVDTSGNIIVSEIMYGYTYTYKFDYIPTAGSYLIYREVSFNTILSREGKFEIVFDKTLVYVTRKEFDDFYNEHILQYPLLPNLYHGLAGYPLALTIECNYGAGISGAGNSPAGGTESVQLRNNITYLDRDRISISVGKKYNTVKSVTKISDKEYIVLFDDSTLSLLIVLYTIDGMSGTGGGGSGTAPDPEYVATDAEIDAMLEQILG